MVVSLCPLTLSHGGSFLISDNIDLTYPDTILNTNTNHSYKDKCKKIKQQ